MYEIYREREKATAKYRGLLKEAVSGEYSWELIDYTWALYWPKHEGR